MIERRSGLNSLARRTCFLIAGTAALGACQPELRSNLPAGPAAYDTIREGPVTPSAYMLRSGDKIAVSVYREERLTQPEIVIDEAGMITLPLVGEVRAAGYSPNQLSRRIEEAYRQGYLRNPQANVLLLQARPRTISVEGQVKTAGVYEIQPGYTLLSAIALAGSPTEQAKLNEILIFRNADGQRLGGRFDLTEIRAGRMPDPQLIPGDVIVVGYSRARGIYQDMLRVMPSVLGTFATIAVNRN